MPPSIKENPDRSKPNRPPTAQIEDDLSSERRQGIEDSGPVSKAELPLIVV